MAGHMKHLDLFAKPLVRPFGDQMIRTHRIDFELKPPPFKKLRIFNHGDGQSMHVNRAAMTLLNRRRIRHMVKVTVRQNQQRNLLVGKGRIRSLRGIKEDVAFRGTKKKGIGVQHPAGE